MSSSEEEQKELLERLVVNIYAIAERELPAVKETLEEVRNTMRSLCKRPFIHHLREYRDEFEGVVIAADSGYITTKYTNFALALVVTYMFSSQGRKQQRIVDVDPSFKMVRSLKYSNLIMTYYSKTKEYELLTKAIRAIEREVERNGTHVFILIDGALSYPEHIETKSTELREQVKKFENALMEFLKEVHKYHHYLHVISFSKKFLLS